MKKKILALTLTVVLVWALLSQIDIRQMWGFIQEFSVRGLALGFGVYMLSYYFRALRWNQLIHSKEVGMGELFLVTSAHIMFNNLLPARSGELSYIYLLKKRHDLPGSEGLATLLVSRLYDFAVLATFFLVSMVFYWRSRSYSLSFDEMVIGSGVLLGLMVLAIFNMNRLVKWGLSFAEHLTKWFGLSEKKAVRFILEKGKEVVASFVAISSNKKYVSIGFSTVGIWGLKFFSFYLMMHAILAGHITSEFHVTYWMIVLGTTAAELTTVLPVHGIGGFGTYESAWAGAFYLLGFPKDLAIKTAFSFHVLGLLYSIILGGGALLLLRLIKIKAIPIPTLATAKPIGEKTFAGRS